MLQKLPASFFLSILVFVSLANFCQAETIELKSGETIEGKILGKNQTHTIVQVKYGNVSVNNQDIANITTIPAHNKEKDAPPPVPFEEISPIPASFTDQSFVEPRIAVLEDNFETISLEEIEKRAVLYFWKQANPRTGLVRDRSRQDAPASIAACGFGMAALCIGAERGWLDARAVEKRIGTILTFFREHARQEHGFFYHFLNMTTGQREWASEISSIDNALLMAGILFVAQYYPNSISAKQANTLLNRVDWPWMLNGQSTFCLEWKPESGFSSSRWDTYAEHLLLCILAMGSPTHPVPKNCWQAWKREFKTYGRYRYVHNPSESLFVYLFSHAWLDFRNRHDGTINYWTNTTQAIKANRKFCLDNKRQFKTYENNIWGLSETDGPSGYRHYGAVPNGHDGTIAPYAMIASINFVPSMTQNGIQVMAKKYGNKIWGPYGFTSGFNRDRGWYSREYVGIHQGLVALMLENHFSGFVWKKMMGNPVVREGMRRAKL